MSSCYSRAKMQKQDIVSMEVKQDAQDEYNEQQDCELEFILNLVINLLSFFGNLAVMQDLVFVSHFP